MADKKGTAKKSAETKHFYEWSPVFLEALAEVPNISRAARIAGINRQKAYKHRESNEAFSSAWDMALEVGADRLEEEMWRRAVAGTEKPITYQGEITATYKEYSDTLAIFLAKAHRPEKFRDRHDITSGGETVQSITYIVENRPDDS